MTQFPPVVEVQIGGVWVDVTSRARRTSPIVIDRGRSDEASRAQPTKTSVILANENGAFTPGNPTSPYYPHVRRGMPLRVRAPGGAAHLVATGVDGVAASTPDHASLDITGDLWLAGEVRVSDWHDFTAETNHDVIYKWGAAGNRSYVLMVSLGSVWLFWSPDGTTQNVLGTGVVPITADGRMAVGGHLDVNNGAGGHTVTFYVAPRLGDPWVQLGDPVTGTGTTSVHASTAPLLVGQVNGDTYKAEVRSGDSTGTVAANPDFTAQTPATTSFQDSTGKTYTVAGGAFIDDHTTRFLGAVDRIHLGWPLAAQRNSGKPQVARATLDASVAMRRMLQGHKSVDSTLRRLVSSPSVANNVVAYWPLEDGRDATSAASPIPGVEPMRVLLPGFQFASDSTLDASGPLPNVPGGRSAGWVGNVPVRSSSQWLVDWFTRIPTAPTSCGIMEVNTTGTVRRWLVSIVSGDIQVVGRNVDGTAVVSSTVPTIADMFGEDQWCLWSLHIEQNGGNVDWELDVVPIPQGFSVGPAGSVAGTVGRVTTMRGFFTSAASPPDGISYGHFVVSTGFGLGWLAGADTAWAGETAAHRFYRLCREEQIPYAIIGDPNVRSHFRGDPVLSTLMGPQRQLPLLDLLEECVEADGGRFLERRDTPGVVFRSRQTLHNQDPAVTFDVAQKGLTPPFDPVLDDQLYRNVVVVNRPDGSSATRGLDPLPDPTEVYDEAFEVNVASDLQLGDEATWRLRLRSSDELRYPGWSTSLGPAGPAVTGAWVDVVEGDRVRAANLMDQVDATADVVVEGWREILDRFTWRVEVNGSPAGPWDVGTIESDSHRLDTMGSVTDSSFAAGTDTSLDVAVTSGPQWTTNSAWFPFEIETAGVVLEVTAIGAPSGGVQTFTVTQAPVNGVVKTIPAGSAVHVAHQVIYTL